MLRLQLRELVENGKKDPGYTSELYEQFADELLRVISQEAASYQFPSAVWLVFQSWIAWKNDGADEEERVENLTRCVRITPVLSECKLVGEFIPDTEENANVLPLW